MSRVETRSGGIGLFGAMFIVFLVLKLTGYIDWSWWWVTAPLWGSVVWVFMIFFVTLLVMSARRRWRRHE